MSVKPLCVTGICGSLRRASHSNAVLTAIAAQLPQNTEFSLLDIGSLPHYNEDLETEGLPASVTAARTVIAESDAVIIVTSEYKHGMPGALKNALDWHPVRPSKAASPVNRCCTPPSRTERSAACGRNTRGAKPFPRYSAVCRRCRKSSFLLSGKGSSTVSSPTNACSLSYVNSSRGY